MPHSDYEMTYNKRSHRYILTEEYVLGVMNIDLKDILNTAESADMANASGVFLGRISKLIYSYIYRIVAFKNSTERDLALDERKRDVLRDAMAEQVIYVLNNGDFSGFSGVNLQSCIAIDEKRIRAAEIAPLARDILINAGILTPIVPRFKRDIEPRYEEEGY